MAEVKEEEKLGGAPRGRERAREGAGDGRLMLTVGVPSRFVAGE